MHLLCLTLALAPRPLPLKIDGTWYDAAEYAQRHKGGAWLLRYAQDRDVTALFRATHLWSEQRADVALAKLPVLAPASLAPTQPPHVINLGDSRLPPISSPLRDDLQALLRRRFPTLESSKASAGHWARTWVAAALAASCWLGWLRFDPLAVALLPLAQWLLAAHTVHEATHGALSSDPRVNFWAQFTAHPLFFNVFVWVPQHLVSHHQHTNDPARDVDLHHFAPARLARAQQKPVSVAPPQTAFNHAWTFLWKGCLTTVGTCFLQPMRTLLDKPTPTFDENLTPVPSAVSKRTLALSMVPSFIVFLYPPLAFAASAAHVPVAAFLAAWLWPWVGASLIWTVMTQTSHVQRSTQPEDADGECWTARQIGTSLDYSTGDPLVTALTAGLNAQGLHHAMPSVASCHFPELYEEYAAVCRKHGVEPRTSRNIGTASREMVEWLFDVNSGAEAESNELLAQAIEARRSPVDLVP